MSRFPGDGADNLEYDHDVKVVVIGDGEVGKTSLMLRFTRNKFDEARNQRTIGVDFESKVVQCKSNTVNCQIWDTAGQERFRGIAAQYYRGCHGVVMVYDTTKKVSFEHIAKWSKDVETHSTTDPIISLWGNKIDLVDEREVSTEEGKGLADQNGWHFVETSAASGDHVPEAFQDLLEQIASKLAPSDDPGVDTTASYGSAAGGGAAGGGAASASSRQQPPAQQAGPARNNETIKLHDTSQQNKKKDKKCAC